MEKWIMVLVALGSGVAGWVLCFRFLKNQGLSISALQELKKTNENLFVENQVSKSNLEALKMNLSNLESQLEAERKSNTSKGMENASLLNENKNLMQRLAEQKQEMEQLNEKLTAQFKNLANEILEEKTKRFTEQNKSNLDEILKPLGDKLKDFEKKVEDTYEKGLRDQSRLQAELLKLHDLNNRISQEAQNLTRALKGDVKKQGNWGEMLLEKILENSGLIRDLHYKTQVSLLTADGQKMLPDVVIYLPDNKHIVVDSKVSLVAYNAYVNAQTEDERAVAVKDHIRSVRSHIKGLAEKNYAHLQGLSTPEYVLMFIPVEASFGVAISEDSELFSYAWNSKIVMVSPSTLIATLLTISSIWKQENQNRNALEIAEKGGQLYDKLVLLVEDLIDVGRKLEDAKKAYELSMNKLHTGKGNLLGRAEAMKKLGAKASKELPQKLVDRVEDELT
mgnify:CR=1 FL=1